MTTYVRAKGYHKLDKIGHNARTLFVEPLYPRHVTIRYVCIVVLTFALRAKRVRALHVGTLNNNAQQFSCDNRDEDGRELLRLSFRGAYLLAQSIRSMHAVFKGDIMMYDRGQ
jgi:hypothetical protein